MMVPIINAIEKVNCTTTKTLRGNDANLPTEMCLLKLLWVQTLKDKMQDNFPKLIL